MVIDIINQLAMNNEVLSDEFFVIVVYTRKKMCEELEFFHFRDGQ